MSPPAFDDLEHARRILTDAIARCVVAPGTSVAEALRVYAACARAAGILPEPMLLELERQLIDHVSPASTPTDALQRWERALDWALRAERRRRWSGASSANEPDVP